MIIWIDRNYFEFLSIILSGQIRLKQVVLLNLRMITYYLLQFCGYFSSLCIDFFKVKGGEYDVRPCSR